MLFSSLSMQANFIEAVVAYSFCNQGYGFDTQLAHMPVLFLTNVHPGCDVFRFLLKIFTLKPDVRN